MRVAVYRNLKFLPRTVYSVRAGGRVIDRAETVYLADAKAKHATDKQLRQVRSGTRQVCQWINGTRLDSEPANVTWRRLACDPKRDNGIVDAETGDRVDVATYVRLDASGAYYSRQGDER